MMKTMKRRLIAALGVGLVLLSGFLSTQAAETDRVAIETSLGRVVVELWPTVAPKTVAQFKQLVQAKAYDGTLVYRVLNRMSAYAGDPLTKDPKQAARWGTGGWEKGIEAEFNDRPHELGVVSMVTRGNPKRVGSQFVFCLGAVPNLNKRYVPFGRVVEGMDVLNRMGAARVKATASGERSRPVDEIRIRAVSFL